MYAIYKKKNIFVINFWTKSYLFKKKFAFQRNEFTITKIKIRYNHKI